MALAFARVDQPGGRVTGSQRSTVTDVTFDASYLSGGEPVTPADLGLQRVEYASATPYTVTGSVNVTGASYDPDTSLLHVWKETPAETTSTNSLDGVVIRVRAFGN